MFRFIYALSADESLDPASLRVDEFDGYEAPGPADHHLAPTGRRASDLHAARLWLGEGLSYAVLRPDEPWPVVAAQVDRTPNEAGLLMIEPWDDCLTVRQLWHFYETLQSRNTRIAWSQSFGLTTHQPPAAVVPVLNLRLGLVRLKDDSAVAIELIERLAGIGFEGYLVADPPTGTDDRLGAALRIVDVARNILSGK